MTETRLVQTPDSCNLYLGGWDGTVVPGSSTDRKDPGPAPLGGLVTILSTLGRSHQSSKHHLENKGGLWSVPGHFSHTPLPRCSTCTWQPSLPLSTHPVAWMRLVCILYLTWSLSSPPHPPSKTSWKFSLGRKRVRMTPAQQVCVSVCARAHPLRALLRGGLALSEGLGGCLYGQV